MTKRTLTDDGIDRLLPYVNTLPCRALGIPCRTVTCFMSGHDGDGSLTISYYYDENGKQLSMINSIWNYHVWNEAWIERKDLPAEYSGWQAADATPQERSKGIFRAGPAPVKAVYNADLGLKYDIPFVYAEVNSDICHFQKDPKSPLGFKLIQRIVNEVGNLVVTESAIPEYAEGEATMEILTGNYKPSEGSDMERHNFYRAVNQMPKSQALYEQIGPMPKDKQDINFTITHIKSIVFGEKFDIALSFKNYSSKKRTVEFNVGVHASLYTGSLIASLKEEHLNINLQPKEIKEVKVAMIADDYKGKLGSASHIKVAVTGMVEETDQLLTAYDTFEVIRPKLEIQVQDYIELGTPFFVTFFFKNPFSTELTNCTLTVEAGKVRRPSVIEISNLPVNGAMEKTIQLMPKHVGKNVIVGVLKSDHPISISGSTYIDIQY